ncbi:MAG TPA: DMT family transporter [Roseiflexaceae bacterium]|nr:DMT family transporter [Roseiflexaceae bacterium]
MLRSTESIARPLETTLSSNDLPMLLVVLIWGANFSVIKVALADIPPLAFVALRFAIAGTVLGFILWRREGTLLPPRRSWLRLILLGVIGNTLYQVLFVLSLAYTTAANSSLLIAATPALVALFGAAFGIERLTRAIAGGVVLAIAGVALVVVARGVELSSATFLGDMLALVAALCWAFYTLGVRTLSGGMSPLAITTLTTIIGLPGLLLVGGTELVQVAWGEIGLVSWSGIAYSSLLAIVLAYLLWNTSVRNVGSNRTAIFGCAIPLVATLVAWPVLGEQPVLLQGIGALLIVGGVLLTRRS